MKVTGGWFDTNDFAITQSLTADAKVDANKRKGKHIEYIKSNTKSKQFIDDQMKSRDQKAKINKSVSSEINFKLSDDNTPENKIQKEMSLDQIIIWEDFRPISKSPIGAEIFECKEESKEESLEENRELYEDKGGNSVDILLKANFISEVVENESAKANYYKKTPKDFSNLKKWGGFSPNDHFSSHFIQKEKNEIRKMALEKRK